MIQTMTTALNRDELTVLIQSLKHFELAVAETDETRMLAARFRRMRDDIGAPAVPPKHHEVPFYLTVASP